MREMMILAVVAVFSASVVGCGATGEVDGTLYPTGDDVLSGEDAGVDEGSAGGLGELMRDGGLPVLAPMEDAAGNSDSGSGGTGWLPYRDAGTGGSGGAADAGAPEDGAGSSGGYAGSSADEDSGAEDANDVGCLDHSECGDQQACVDGYCIPCDGIYMPEACEPELQTACTPNKLLVCHHPHGDHEASHEICVSQKAWLQAHSKHDKDYLGHCK